MNTNYIIRISEISDSRVRYLYARDEQGFTSTPDVSRAYTFATYEEALKVARDNSGYRYLLDVKQVEA